MSYGFVRSVTYEWRESREYYQQSTGFYVQKEMLFADKAGSVVSGTFGATLFWPSMILRDLMRVECALRGKNI